MLCGINVRFQTVSHSVRQVPHVLLTRPPLTSSPKEIRSFDLHVLGAPPAFVLSQDQTLWTCYIYSSSFKPPNISKFVFPKLLKVSLTLLYFWNLLKWIQGFNSSCSSRMLFNFQGPPCRLFRRQLRYYIIPSLLCQHLFWIFSSSSSPTSVCTLYRCYLFVKKRYFT